VGDTKTSKGNGSRLPWLIALCLITLAVLFRLAGQAFADPVRGGTAAVVESRQDGGGMKAPVHPVPTQAAASRTRRGASPGKLSPDDYLVPGDDFATVERRLADRATYDHRALDVMYYATLVCGKAVNPEWRTTSRTQKARVFSAWKDTFCGGRTTSEEAAGYQSIMLKQRVQSRAEWEKGDGSTNSTLVHFEQEVYSDFPPVMAAGLLDIPDYLDWPLGAEDVRGTPYAAKLPRYQQVALQGIQCSQVGGCGPNDLMTMWLCLTTSGAACSSTTSTDDMWADEFAPDEIAIIARIQQRILDERSRRLAARPNTAPTDRAR